MAEFIVFPNYTIKNSTATQNTTDIAISYQHIARWRELSNVSFRGRSAQFYELSTLSGNVLCITDRANYCKYVLGGGCEEKA
jgi:hypothetical protein